MEILNTANYFVLWLQNLKWLDHNADWGSKLLQNVGNLLPADMHHILEDFYLCQRCYVVIKESVLSLKVYDENNKLKLYNKILNILIIWDHIVQTYFHVA